MRNFVIMGVQGSGKGTQSKQLAKHFSLLHLGVGDQFRNEIKQQSSLAQTIKNIIDKGNMVPDEMVIKIMAKRLAQPDTKNGYILDGFPRTLPQAQFALDNIPIDAVLILQVPDEVVIQRVLARRLCSNCGRDYNLDYKPPKTPGLCDVCGAKLIQRADDYEEAIKKRIADYHAQTAPTIERLKTKFRIETFDATQDSKDVQQQIRERIDFS
ncbi:Adenylate kinase [Poriferisphaera corsica]|uniref:Adenylate kinase n=1 Tax=Poriferisphaera corsica TaxID=2528020 RepID=A0A517YQD3_9BACT|nr:nucleoside monophosphate kinase [Poriferisphaera corsica]QDU32435.1 Adenylate kinase [Poriferisphaera corsica]